MASQCHAHPSYQHISIFLQKNGLSTQLAVELFIKVEIPGPDLTFTDPGSLGMGPGICIMLLAPPMHTQCQVCNVASLCPLGCLLESSISGEFLLAGYQTLRGTSEGMNRRKPGQGGEGSQAAFPLMCFSEIRAFNQRQRESTTDMLTVFNSVKAVMWKRNRLTLQCSRGQAFNQGHPGGRF